MGSYLGRAVAIEVKQPGGKLSVEQSEFIDGWINRGRGIAIVAMSLDAVKAALALVQTTSH